MVISANGAGTLTNQQRILLALDDAVKKLETLERAKSEPIAIVGMGCRFPGGATDPEAFWQLLHAGVDAVTETPRDRWKLEDFYDPDPEVPGKTYTRYGGFLEQIDLFDPQFFGISPREAMNMDPQQRLLLEVAWEALEHAGSIPNLKAPSQTGVFIGVTTNDYARLITPEGNLDRIDAYYLTGNPLNAIAGRLAYTFGLQGPCMAVDTACSSSLVAVHLAVQSLRNRECDSALAGGVNLILSPENTVALSKTQILSAEGRCKTFDASADGIVRGEGCGAIVLKRLSDAVAQGDRIWSLIRGSAVNQDGRSSGFTVPNKSAQQALIQQALNNAKLPPEAIDYVEAHGTGTPLGDPIELRALGEVLGDNRSAKKPLLVGSVKTNFGHLESAAGIAGLLKVVLSMHHETIPAHLHFRQPNPHIDWGDLNVQVTSESTSWNRNGKPRAAGVSSFGASGTNAHIIVEEAPISEPAESTADRPVHVLCLSAKSAGALQQLLQSYSDYLIAHPELSIENVCYSANTGRSHLNHRISLLARSSQDLLTTLSTLPNSGDEMGSGTLGLDTPGVCKGVAENASPRIAFLFTGQGSQYWGMGRELYLTQPRFRAVLDRCSELLQPSLDCPLVSLLFGATDTSTTLNQTVYTQPALFALEYSLAQLWMSWGIRPTMVMGHSVGEYVAACIAGVFSLEDGIRLIAERGRLMQALPSGGGMVSVKAAIAEIEQAIAGIPNVTVAAINGPHSIVMSGEHSALETVTSKLQGAGFKTQTLTVSHAFHSALMEPMVEQFQQVAQQASYHPPKLNLISNVTGEAIGAEIASADYWCRHIRQPVQFDKGMQTLSQLGPDVYLELGPKPILLGMGRQCVSDEHALWLSSLRPPQRDWHTLLSSLGQLYVAGATIDWKEVDADYVRERVTLPSYPFQRQRYWVDAAQPSNDRRHVPAAGLTAPTRQLHHSLLGRKLLLAETDKIRFEGFLRHNSPAYLDHHRIYGTPIVPATGYVEMALAAAVATGGNGGICLENISIQKPLVLPAGAEQTIQIVIDSSSSIEKVFQVFSLQPNEDSDEPSWLSHATAEVTSSLPAADTATLSIAQLKTNYPESVPVEQFYRALHHRGMEYGTSFQTVVELYRQKGAALGRVSLPRDLQADIDRYQFHPALLDGCMQVLGATFEREGLGDAYLPVTIERLQVFRRVGATVWSKVQLLSNTGVAGKKLKSKSISAEISIYNEAGQEVARLEGVTLRRVGRRTLERLLHQDVTDWLYQLTWQPQPLAPDNTNRSQPGMWLVFADAEGIGEQLAKRLREHGDRCVLASIGSSYMHDGGDRYVLNPARPEHFQQLLQESCGDSPDTCRGVIHLLGLSHSNREAASTLANLQQAQIDGCGSFLHLAQTLIDWPHSSRPRLWTVTAGTCSPGETEQPLRIEQSTLWGLGPVVALEAPDLRCTCIDLDADATDSIEILLAEIMAGGRENRVAYRQHQRYVARLQKLAAANQKTNYLQLPKEQQFQLRLNDYGIDNLTLEPASRKPPAAGEVEVQVRAVGLNFRDVLNALGMLKDFTAEMGISVAEELPFGGECTGIVVAVGDGVDRLQVGEEVMVAQALGCLASFVTVPADFVIRKPKHLSFEEAATIPTAFLTADYALRQLADLQPGERVLIHSAAGGVGQAAVQIALKAGAEVYGTASQPKWSFLTEMGVKHVFNSRTLDFADEIAEATADKGVDVVLNCLNGDYIPKSLDVLGADGRFVEIGKIGIWDTAKAGSYRADVGYRSFDLLDICLEDTSLIATLLAGVTQRFESGELQPLPHKVFPLQKAADAFRFMAQSKHIGKVVVSIPTSSEDTTETIHSNGSYLISGGLGALGLQVAQWLADRGAKHLVLAGRRAPDQAAEGTIAHLTASGVSVRTVAADISQPKDVKRLLAESGDIAPLRGIVHAAGQLDDGPIEQQTWERFERVMAAKVTGSWLLHTLSQDIPLDFFVCFSSFASLLGSPGQGNYAAANAFMDALMQHRRSLRLPGLSINWGPWASGGMATKLGSRELDRWQAQGIRMLSPEKGLQALDRLLEEQDRRPAQVAVLPVNWHRFSKQLGATVPLLDLLVDPLPAMAPQKSQFLQILEGSAPNERNSLVLAHIRQQVATVIGIPCPEQMDVRSGFMDLGMDSLMSVELRNRLQASLGCSISPNLLFNYPTVEALATQLSTTVLSDNGSTPQAENAPEEEDASDQISTASEAAVPGITAVEELTDREAEELLLNKLDSLRY